MLPKDDERIEAGGPIEGKASVVVERFQGSWNMDDQGSERQSFPLDHVGSFAGTQTKAYPIRRTMSSKQEVQLILGS